MKLQVKFVLIVVVLMMVKLSVPAQQLVVAGRVSQLEIREAASHSVRIILKPVSYTGTIPSNPALANNKTYKAPFLTLLEKKNIKTTHGNFRIEINQSPLQVKIFGRQNRLLQAITFKDDESFDFMLNDEYVLGMGGGGSKPAKGVNWRSLPVEFDRRSRYDSMQPRWQTDAYGSRNPVPMFVGTSGWALFVASPWVHVDLRNKAAGTLIPWKPTEGDKVPQTVKNQGMVAGKGLPPVNEIIPGYADFFVFDAADPLDLMKDFSTITGPATMPPKWALGYMQSHRTLEDDRQMLGVIDTFRTKKIPLDAVIYLGTGFTPRGWNKEQPSFEFNPEVFKRDPAAVIKDMHADKVKVILHMVPWDRDKLPNLHGNIPALPGEKVDASHIQYYWNEHMPLVNAGVDAFWPDEGDWLNLYERIKRHQLYYQGHLSANPNLRPWNLARNAYPGIAKWGGWVWSGDTESSWKTLEAQIAVALNYSLSIGPYWGSDIGGFFPNEELTGELYARWFQFGAFSASFRSHGVTWHTRLPWGWSGNDMGPIETKTPPLQSEMNNKAIEPVIKQYDELRYQMMPYIYTLTWEAKSKGLPLMRPLWMHYPTDKTATQTADEFLWGSNILVAPVYEKGATSRKVYLPEGDWYDWWTNKKETGKQTITRNVDLSIMPLYVKAGSIIPVDPIRQYTAEKVDAPTTLKIYTGKNGSYTLYEDDGISMDYKKEKYNLTAITWDDKKKQLLIQSTKKGMQVSTKRSLRIELIPQNISKDIIYNGTKQVVTF